MVISEAHNTELAFSGITSEEASEAYACELAAAVATDAGSGTGPQVTPADTAVPLHLVSQKKCELDESDTLFTKYAGLTTRNTGPDPCSFWGIRTGTSTDSAWMREWPEPLPGCINGGIFTRVYPKPQG